MDFFDEIKARAADSFNNISTDINDYFKSRITEAVVKVGEPPRANLTALQVAQGQTGAPSQSQVIPASSGVDMKMLIPVVAVGALFIFLFKGSK